jgi:hypothetical protein
VVCSPFAPNLNTVVMQSACECQWSFVHYHPSPLEAQWFTNIDSNQGRVCAATAEIPTADIDLWLSYAAAAVAPPINDSICLDVPPPQRAFQVPSGRNSTPSGSPQRDVSDVMSTHEYVRRCTCDGVEGNVSARDMKEWHSNACVHSSMCIYF